MSAGSESAERSDIQDAVRWSIQRNGCLRCSPAFIAPSYVRQRIEDDKYIFRMDFAFRLIGAVFAYGGALEPNCPTWECVRTLDER